MAHCQSYVFFPDDPKQPPQFSDCPRTAETRRTSFRMGVAVVVRLCGRCAREWDDQAYAGIERSAAQVGIGQAQAA